MEKSDILAVPYFVYDKAYPWAKVCLRDEDVLSMLERIEGGENLFEVIPGFSKDPLYSGSCNSFRCGRFENRREIHYENEIFDSRIGAEQIGRLLVPHCNTISRESLASRNLGRYTPDDLHSYEKILSEFPDVETFYYGSIELEPLDPENILVLNEKQLE